MADSHVVHLLLCCFRYHFLGDAGIVPHKGLLQLAAEVLYSTEFLLGLGEVRQAHCISKQQATMISATRRKHGLQRIRMIKR